jgi:hypothetical protein
VLVERYPVYYDDVDDVHLYRHPKHDTWHLSPDPFDPADDACVAKIPAVSGPVPTGARAWRVWDGADWVDAGVTIREVA